MASKTAQPFRAEMLRPDDLLHLTVDGDNLHLVRDPDRGPLLKVANPAQPAFLRFTFAPQTIAESASFEATIVKPDGDPQKKGKDPDESRPSTYHDPLPDPGTTSVSANTAAQVVNKIPTVAQVSHPSRLVFIVSEDAAIPFTFEGLLEWSKMTLSVSGIAAIGENPTPDQIANAPAIHEPGANQTAIELPYQLVISPTRKVAWLHRSQPFTSRGRTELWHTRLALKNNDKITELSKTDLAPLRAIWSPDYDPNALPAVKDDPNLGRTAMCGNDRHQIVVLTSAFHGYEQEIELELLAPALPASGAFSSAALRTIKWKRQAPYVPQPFHADRLMLSSLGGWLRSRGQWKPPRRKVPVTARRPDFAEIFKDIKVLRAIPRRTRAPVERPIDFIAEPFLFFQRQEDEEQLDLSEWVHLATQGRDHYVRIVYEGELWPFRHPAALIKVTERKFEEINGIVGAYLMQRMFIVVRKPEMQFGEADYGNLFNRVVLTTRVTPDIAEPTPIFGKRSFWVQVMTGPGSADRRDFTFHAVGYDATETAVDFTVPMMFVSRSDLDSTDPIADEYNKTSNINRRSCAVPGQKLSFVKPVEKANENTRLCADALNFVMDKSRVQPTLLKASVRIPQVRELLGADLPTSIRLLPAYVSSGLNQANKTGVFAQVVGQAYSELNTTDPSVGLAKLPVAINADQAGGIATPNLGITNLSRELGPLAGKVEDAVTNTFSPAEFFPKGAAMLFGSFDLVDLFLPPGPAPAGMTLDRNAPKITIERTGTAIVTTLDWEPKFLDVPDGKLDLGIAAILKDQKGTSTLSIHSIITKPTTPASPGTSDFSGSLNAFQVSILKSVFINFAQFSFSKKSNEKTDVKVQLDPATPLEFGGDLKFVREIRNAIPPGLFGDGPSLDLISSPLGIRAGFAFALPPLTVAVFSLKDVKLSAALTLPFLDGKPVFDFNISERPHPFLLAVGIFGGGGFFHLQLDTAGMKALEVSLEFGATAALDIGVASGEVHIMAGIYFSLQRKEGSSDLVAILSGYLRLGGSLNVLGLVSISVEFNLSFTYDSGKDKAYGRATLTVSIHVLLFSASVELTVERAFGGSGDPHFIDFFPKPEPWEEYAIAFA
jgi:hypothetical protein